jgi:hypothetical protein
MLVIGCTVDEPEIFSVPLTGADDGASEPGAPDGLGEAPLQAARSRVPAIIPARASRVRGELINAVLRAFRQIHAQHPGGALTDPLRPIKAV